ncbi:D-alanyl-D-alanine carboxypeptidase family protein [Microbacterium sp. P03]|uniref:D-alanyl-D-alanine carboxypeptidase family protein n=1 Tax=Microbacterium sp. P03 TaxID=3366946 RepID=UPI003746628C
MTIEDAPAPALEVAPLRRDRRREDAGTGPVALGWVDDASVAPTTSPGMPAVQPDLLANAPRRKPFRPGTVIPTAIILALLALYAATTLLWPLHAVAPTVAAIEVQPVAAPAAALPWPAEGSAAVEISGIGTLASAEDAVPMASITKVVTALLVLEEMPLAQGEQGPDFAFTSADRAAYWSYLSNNESALNVPVGGTLSEYQMLQGMLMGSAGNYADRLAGNLWPSDVVFAKAANTWLSAHGVPGITVVEPTGIEYDNLASPSALLKLGEKALANPVIAEIVATRSVDLPGAGIVENTNGLLADPGVLGIKTGSLDGFNVLSAKQITIGATPVRLYVSMLDQPDDETRVAASRALYTALEQELQLRPSVTAGTVVGTVTTRWGEKADIVVSSDADVVLWNGGVATVQTTYALGDHRDDGDTVGSLEVAGPVDTAQVDIQLAGDIEPPSAWWRLTHPLDLFGLNG